MDGFIFNFNVTNEDTLRGLDYYINDVKKERNNKYDSIILANYCDLEERRVITKEEIKNYEQKYNIKIFDKYKSTRINNKLNKYLNF